jgi:uncharacterized iron-regulated membrane protein
MIRIVINLAVAACLAGAFVTVMTVLDRTMLIRLPAQDR